MTYLNEIGFLVFIPKEAVLSAHYKYKETIKPTFTNLPRNKFGVNHETFIY